MAADDQNVHVGLGDFLKLAGSSISEAQAAIAPLDQPTQLVIGNAEVEAKVTMETTPKGGMAVHTISSSDIRRSGLNPGVLSTVRINYVATASEPKGIEPSVKPARKDLAAVIAEVSRQPDVENLSKILGPLEYRTTFVPDQNRWLVVAHDAKGRLIRETIVPD